VTLVAKRKNAKVANAPPECAKGGIHTEWKVSKKEKGGKITKTETFSSKDTLKLDENWFKPEATVASTAAAAAKAVKPGSTPTMRDKDGKLTDAGREQHNAIRDEAKAEMKGTGTPNQATTANQIADQKMGVAQGISQGLTGVQAIAGTVMDFTNFLTVINWDKEPLEVQVAGAACSGGCDYTLYGYPGEKATFKVDDSLFNKIRAVLRVLEAIVKGGKYLASFAGGGVDAELHLLEGCKIQLDAQWKELTKDNEEIKKYKHNVDLEWSVAIGREITKSEGSATTDLQGKNAGKIEKEGDKKAANLAAFGLKFGMEIVSFINVFLPSVGTIAAKVLNWLGAHATAGIDFNFTAEWEIAIKHIAGESECSLSFAIPCLVDIYINIKLTWGTSLEVSGGCIVKTSPTFAAKMPLKKRGIFDMELSLEKGDISFGFRGVFKVDTWWYKTNQSVDYIPPWGKVNYGPYAWHPLTSFA